MKLVVTSAFADYKRGEEIKDPEAIKKILAGDQAQYVVKVAVEPKAAK